MVGLENATGIGGALQTIGVVLLEAVLLYVGYGAVERFLGPSLVEALRGEQ